tara:strand:- start:48 stop:3656 length:3609 start_codon:yes stop_codon:yes gene_type:complete
MSSFEERRNKMAFDLGNLPITSQNPNLLYKDYLSPTQLNTLTLESPVIARLATEEKGPEWLAERLKFVDKIKQQKLSNYKRPPIELDIEERYPMYVRGLAQKQESDEAPLREEELGGEELAQRFDRDPSFLRSIAAFRENQGPTVSDDNPLVTEGTLPSSRERTLDASIVDTGNRLVGNPYTPIGLDESKRLAQLGFDPFAELTSEYFKGGNSASQKLASFQYRAKMGLIPRNPTVEDVEYLGKQYGLVGDYMYSEPSLGKNSRIMFRAEGDDKDAWKVINSPEFTWNDTSKVLVNELPAIAGEIAAAVVGPKKFSTPLGMVGNIKDKTKAVAGMSALSGLGAAAGDFTRLAVGSFLGAHDRDFMDVLEESGVVAAWAVGGTFAISATAESTAKLWALITKSDVSPEYMQKIKAMYDEAKRAESTVPGAVYDESISIDQLKLQLEDLAEEFNSTLLDGYSPTAASQAGTTEGADMEALFLKFADDPEIMEKYGAIKLNNRNVIQEVYRIIKEKIGPDTAGAATGATTTASIRRLVEEDADLLAREGEEVITRLKTDLGGAGDSAVPGLFKRVDDSEASSGLFQRGQSRILQIAKNYKKPFNEAWKAALENPKYARLTTGADATKEPTTAWLNARKGEVGKVLNGADADEAVREFYNLIPTDAKETLFRLQGRSSKIIDGESGPVVVDAGRNKNPKFTLDELNQARVALNDFSSNLPNQTGITYKSARNLERGLEDQMEILIKEGASAESGLKQGSKELDKWIQENKWGNDLVVSWTKQGEAYRLGNSTALRALMAQERPEKVVEYLISTKAKGSSENKVVTDLVTVLKQEGSEELKEIKGGIAGYIQREILNAPGLSPMAIAKNYRKFIQENEGMLKAVYGTKGYNKRFRGSTANSFEKTVIGELNRIDEGIMNAHRILGISGPDGNKSAEFLVSKILKATPEEKQAGDLLGSIKYLAELGAKNPELEEQVAQVSKRVILQDILKARQGKSGLWEFDDQALNDFLTEGFGPKSVSGETLSFDNFYEPLLGKDGPKFFKNLKYMNDMIQRELGAKPSERVASRLNKGDFGEGSNIEGVKFIQRMILSPLSKVSRRTTAISNMAAENSRVLIGKMLMDEELFDRTTRLLQGRENTQRYIRFLYSLNDVHLADIANEMDYYDTQDKEQKTPKRTVKTTQQPSALRTDQTITGFSDRVLDVFNGDE